MTSRMLIIVHGTNDADPSDSGERWWQNGGSFNAALREHGGQDTEVIPFHWSGENSDVERLKGAKALARLIKTKRQDGKTITLAGHSHGGNVIMEALGMLGGPDSVDKVVTLGTPFFKRKLKLLPTLINGYQIVLGLSILIFMFLIALPSRVSTMLQAMSGKERPNPFADRDDLTQFEKDIMAPEPYDLQESVFDVFVSLALGVLGLVLLWFGIRAFRHIARARKRIPKHVTAKDWLVLYTPRDEAIRLLEAAATLNHTYVTPRACKRTLRGLGILAGLLSVAIATAFLWQDIIALFRDPGIEGIEHSNTRAVGQAIMVFGAFFLPGFALMWLLSVIGGDRVLAWMMNSGIRTGLVGAAYGADGRWDLTEVGPVPPYLPDVQPHAITRTDMGGLSDEMVLAAARDLYDQVVAAEDASLAIANPETLWTRLNDALYHNAYMKDEEIIAQIADHLFSGKTA